MEILQHKRKQYCCTVLCVSEPQQWWLTYHARQKYPEKQSTAAAEWFWLALSTFESSCYFTQYIVSVHHDLV